VTHEFLALRGQLINRRAVFKGWYGRSARHSCVDVLLVGHQAVIQQVLHQQLKADLHGNVGASATSSGGHSLQVTSLKVSVAVRQDAEICLDLTNGFAVDLAVRDSLVAVGAECYEVIESVFGLDRVALDVVDLDVSFPTVRNGAPVSGLDENVAAQLGRNRWTVWHASDDSPSLPHQLQGCLAELRHSQPEFMNSADEAAEVASNHLAQHFVELTDLGLATERVSELGLDHAERGLHVRPLVVVGCAAG